MVAALGDGASARTVAEAAAARIVVIAVPWVRVPEALAGLQWNGQIVIDATKDFDPSDLAGRTSSEVVADLVGGAAVVKAATRSRLPCSAPIHARREASVCSFSQAMREMRRPR